MAFHTTSYCFCVLPAQNNPNTCMVGIRCDGFSMHLHVPVHGCVMCRCVHVWVGVGGHCCCIVHRFFPCVSPIFNDRPFPPCPLAPPQQGRMFLMEGGKPCKLPSQEGKKSHLDHLLGWQAFLILSVIVKSHCKLGNKPSPSHLIQSHV